MAVLMAILIVILIGELIAVQIIIVLIVVIAPALRGLLRLSFLLDAGTALAGGLIGISLAGWIGLGWPSLVLYLVWHDDDRRRIASLLSHAVYDPSVRRELYPALSTGPSSWLSPSLSGRGGDCHGRMCSPG